SKGSPRSSKRSGTKRFMASKPSTSSPTKSGEAAMAKAVRINASAREIVPAVHAVLDAYPTYTTAQEKNDALRMVLSRVEYTRTVGGFGSDPQDFEVKIFPKLPEPVE
ncbi:MAG: hypothetical protein PUC10_06320, partial [Clostridiales bacterium]|nr:hypothetical protein [Clostridiales bacterium]